MTARYKEASGSALAVPFPAPVNGAANGTDRSALPSWEDWFRHAGPQQRAFALGLAQQQGFLYSHQLPAVSNGKTPPAAESPASALLSRLLAGKFDTLPPLDDVSLSCFDADLDEVQRQAVLRALAAPDLFMLQGLPGTGKSRVLAEIIRQSARRGWRVLFLGGQTASVDVVLKRLAGMAELLAVRILESTEKPESLPAWLRSFTLDEQKKAFCQRVETGARGNREQIEAACRRMADQASAWGELEACAERWRALQDRRRKLDSQGEPQATSPAAAVPEPTAADGLDGLRESLAKCDQQIAVLAAKVAELEPGYSAKKGGQFWTPAFWQSLFAGGIVQEMESTQQQLAQARADRESLVQQIADIERQRAEASDRFKREQAARLQAEISARQEQLRSQSQSLDDEQRRLDDEWAMLCRGLDADAIDRTPEGIAAAHEAWLRKKKLSEEECQFAHQWAKFIEESASQWAGRLASFANLLAGGVGRWCADARFRETAGGPFDLVIVEDADALTEADVIKLARFGGRCVLVGSAIVPPPLEKSRSTGPKLTASPCWPRLWQALGGDAGCWPHAWQREEGRLICKLLPLSVDDHQYLEYEGLADSPDIELGILHRPGAGPCLAEVSFGPERPFADAFAFMIREVQEFPVQPLGRTAWWREDERSICRHMGLANGNVDAWLDVESGLRLGAAADGCGEATRIAAIEFHKSAGWDRASADAWLVRHRPVRDPERTACLQIPYRYHPPLAKFVTAIIRSGDWVTAHPPAAMQNAAGFEFIAVPAVPKRESAGVELDLSAPRSADKLPTGLRHGLPAHGFVNYLEAQALIGRLEAWSQKEAADSSSAAVLALYEGQAVLLRRLVEQSEILRGRRHPLEIAVPSRLHQREYDVVFLSLTRSHPHRPAPFGDDPRELPTALTRARARLFIFGDLGAIHQRLGCRDQAIPAQEADHLARLLAHFQA